MHLQPEDFRPALGGAELVGRDGIPEYGYGL
jgi:hypothetical protein